MKINKRLTSVALALTFLVLFLILMSSTASALYALQTSNGNYLTAVGGGGQITNAIRSDATAITGYEKFNLVPLGGSQYALQTFNGNYLTAVGGGGQITNAIRSDATAIIRDEKFNLILQNKSVQAANEPPQAGNWYALQTSNGYYLTAVGGGGRTTDAIRSDATAIKEYEKFMLIPI